MDTLLVVEDDKLFRTMLRESLERNDFVVLEAMNCKRSIEILGQHKVDLILLDLRLPDGYGLDLMPDIRKKTDVPLIILSGDLNQDAKIDGLSGGADDYVCKPFDPDELVARINSNLRRYKTDHVNGGISQHTGHEEDGLHIGKWALDRNRFQLVDDEGNAGDLSVREFRLLDKLARCPGRALKREDLCQAIREDNYVPTPRAIDVKITRIRKKIGDDASDPQIIKTVRGVGYMYEPTQ